MFVCLFWILSNKLDLNQETRFTISLSLLISRSINAVYIKLGTQFNRDSWNLRMPTQSIPTDKQTKFEVNRDSWNLRMPTQSVPTDKITKFEVNRDSWNLRMSTQSVPTDKQTKLEVYHTDYLKWSDETNR